jgi:hypothetical protein
MVAALDMKEEGVVGDYRRVWVRARLLESSRVRNFSHGGLHPESESLLVGYGQISHISPKEGEIWGTHFS